MQAPNFKKFPNCEKGYKYAVDVVENKTPSCIYIKAACERFLSDLEKGEFPFVPENAEKFMRLAQKFKHIKGDWDPPNVVFEPWQCFIFSNIFGFIDPRTNKRRFRVAYVEIPRGNGKSLMASLVGLYFLALDNPKGNEISCFATTSDQARIVLDTARAMAKANKSFLKATKSQVLAHKIVHPESNSVMRFRSSEANNLDGLNDVLSIIDELHAVDQELYDVVYSGMKKRRDSLLLCITTAGLDMDGVGFSQSQYAKKVALGEYTDDQTFSAVYTVDEGDDIFSEKSWRKANPNFGVSVDPVAFEASAKKAQVVPSDLASFKIKNLNIWLSEAKAFFDVGKWDECADPTLKIEDFRNEKCMIGLDVASKIDLTSVGIVFKRGDMFYLFDRSYVPEERVLEIRSAIYEDCVGSGHLIATKGEAINYDQIYNDIIDLSKKFRIQELNADPWNSLEISQRLERAKIPVQEFRMNVANLSEPTKTLDALIRQGKIRHNGSPLLRWCLGNVVCRLDHNGNVFPRKSHERLKIDPIIAILMALASWLRESQIGSVYESRGLRFIE